MESAVSWAQPCSQEGRESYPASRGSCQVSASGTSLASVGVSPGAVRTEQAPTALGGAD